ncbi:CU044_2847 family protein [Micromonospora chalcea]|uniref:CU044_2847 family protein n=1 Tax=Micromonospora chalcea TaxID=1874 RepID=UPI0033DDB9D4
MVLAMAGQVIAVRVDGVEVLVETARVVGTEPTAIGDRAQQQVMDAFERAQDAIIAVSTKVAGTVRQLAARGARPDKVEVEFGLKFTAKGDVIVASGAGEVALKVIVGYDPRPGAADAGSRRADDDEADDEADGVS